MRLFPMRFSSKRFSRMRRALLVSLVGMVGALATPLPLEAQETRAQEDRAQDADGTEALTLAERAVAEHIVPGYSTLATRMAALMLPAATCDAAALRDAYHDAYDAWMRVQHIAFGPVEQGDRRFALAFWPDTKGFVRKALGRMIAAKDPVVADPDAFARVSVAARSLTALERLLYDESGPIGFDGADGPYRCDLARAVSRGLSRTATDMLLDWTQANGAARSFVDADPALAGSDLFRSIDGGLEALSALRIGRPLGSLERSWPRRAEAWRSGRSARNVRISLEALEAMFRTVFAPEMAEADRDVLLSKFDRARVVAARIPDDFSVIETDVQARLRLEAARDRIRDLQAALRASLAPALGVPVGFNSLDGD